MKKRVYTFCSIFSYDEDGITITFPDLPGCISCAYSTDEAIFMAQDALGLYLDGMSESEIPIPSDKNDIMINNEREKIFAVSVEV